MPYRVFLHDDTGELALTFFRGQGQLAGKGAAGRRDRNRQRQDRLVQRPPLDGASGLHGAGGGSGKPAAGRADLSADGGPFGPYAAQVDRGGPARMPDLPGVDRTTLCCRSKALPQPATVSLPCTNRATKPISTRRRPPAAGLPMTSSWPGSYPCRWSARDCARSRARRCMQPANSASQCATPCPFR